MKFRKVAGYLLPLGVAAFAIAMVVYPELSLQSAVKGLKLWWDVVFPSLLPFFIASELLMGLGVVHFLGVLLEPIMRPLFNVPGPGSFVMALGYASGFPIGAVLTGKLRTQGLVTKTEGERLTAFTNAADPLFMAGAVAVGMLGRPELAGLLMLAHYLAGISTGLVFRFYRRASADRTAPLVQKSDGANVITRAVRAMTRARTDDARPFGTILGDAMRTSINTLLVIGGFITVFSVAIGLLTKLGVIGALAGLVATVLRPLGFGQPAAQGLVIGLVEVSNGCQAVATAAIPMTQKLVMTGVVLAWSGLSVLGQVAAVLKGTDLSLRPYVTARAVQGVLAGLWTWVLMAGSIPAMAAAWVSPYLTQTMGGGAGAWILRLGFFGQRLLITLGLMLLAAAFVGLIRSIRIIAMRVR